MERQNRWLPPVGRGCLHQKDSGSIGPLQPCPPTPVRMTFRQLLPAENVHGPQRSPRRPLPSISGSRFPIPLAISKESLRTVAPAMFRRRMVVHLPECAGEIKLVREPELIADLLDGQIRGVEQLHGVLHAQMVQVAQRSVAGHPPKKSRVV